jgi:formamidopyrimidine-DNA glycosylase
MKKEIKVREREMHKCDNCGEIVHLVATFVGEDGEKSHFCEVCLSDSE